MFHLKGVLLTEKDSQGHSFVCCLTFSNFFPKILSTEKYVSVEVALHFITGECV